MALNSIVASPNFATLPYHPSPASSLQALPSRIAEWETLEARCKARSGEAVPGSFRTLALLSMCPNKGSRPGELSLKETLLLKTEVATGDISYDELKELIMSHIHAQMGKSI